MSGLLVKSTLVMRDNLEELNGATSSVAGPARRRRAHAVTTSSTTSARSTTATSFYGKDAFEGLRHMDAIMAFKRGETTAGAREPARRKASHRAEIRGSSSTERSPEVALGVDVPKAPFIGTRVVKGVPVPEIAKWLNQTALFRGRWQYSRRKGQSIEEYTEFLTTDVESNAPLARSRAASRNNFCNRR